MHRDPTIESMHVLLVGVIEVIHGRAWLHTTASTLDGPWLLRVIKETCSLHGPFVKTVTRIVFMHGQCPQMLDKNGTSDHSKLLLYHRHWRY
jgi:hypothetical protein